MPLASQAAIPLELPHLTNAQAITARNLSRRRAPFQLQTEIGDVALRLAGEDALANVADFRLQLLRTGGMRWVRRASSSNSTKAS